MLPAELTEYEPGIEVETPGLNLILPSPIRLARENSVTSYYTVGESLSLTMDDLRRLSGGALREALGTYALLSPWGTIENASPIAFDVDVTAGNGWGGSPADVHSMSLAMDLGSRSPSGELDATR